MNDFKFMLGEYVCCIYNDYFTGLQHIDKGIVVSQIRHREIYKTTVNNYYEVMTAEDTVTVKEIQVFKVLYCED